MERAILHSDLNCFYASVEMMLDPRLRGKAVAVCGYTEDRHGIVLAKSEKAKRAGVKTGMVNWEAQRCCKASRRKSKIHSAFSAIFVSVFPGRAQSTKDTPTWWSLSVWMNAGLMSQAVVPSAAMQ